MISITHITPIESKDAVAYVKATIKKLQYAGYLPYSHGHRELEYDDLKISVTRKALNNYTVRITANGKPVFFDKIPTYGGDMNDKLTQFSNEFSAKELMLKMNAALASLETGPTVMSEGTCVHVYLTEVHKLVARGYRPYTVGDDGTRTFHKVSDIEVTATRSDDPTIMNVYATVAGRPVSFDF